MVRMGNSWNGDIAFTILHNGMWDETRIFQDHSTSSLDVAYTVRNGKLYLGDSSFSSGILYTFKDRQIFVGDSTFPMDVAYTLREETRRFSGAHDVPLWGIYKGDSRSWSDRIAVIEGAPEAAAVFALLSASGWL